MFAPRWILPVAFIGLALLAAGSARAQTAFGSVTVDTGPLAATVGPAWAAIVRTSLQPALQRALAGRLSAGRGGARLVVRVRDASLNENAYGGVGRGSGGFNTGGGINFGTDNMEGDVLIVGANGRVLNSFPLRAAPNADNSGAWYTPGFEQRRLDALSDFYAYWVRRRLDG